jgi:hypothetical protein
LHHLRLRPAVESIAAPMQTSTTTTSSFLRISHRLTFALSIAASCACVALAGCANPTSVRWNKADNYAGKPARVLLVTDIGSEYGDEFAAGFTRQFTALAAGCGASLDTVRTSPNDRARAEDQPRARDYAADTVLSIRRSGGTRSGGLVIHVIYDIRLIEMSARLCGARRPTSIEAAR